MSRFTAGCCVTLLLAAAFTGCRPADEVRTYETPKGSVAAPARDAAPSGPPTDRMIAAILRGDQSAWFFKVVGGVDQLEPVADEAHKVLASLEFDERSRPAWNLPEGWEVSEDRGEFDMRLATLMIPTENEAVEMSVTPLGLSGDWDAQVLDNVNRWRGQLGLPPLASEAELADSEQIAQLSVDGRELVVFDAKGHFEAGSMVAPFAGAAGAPPMIRTPPREDKQADAGPPLSYTLPEGWQELPASGIRLADLRAGAAEVMAFAFSSDAPAMADPLANVNRWRGEIGMPPIEQQEFEESAEVIAIDGADATYVELLPEGGAESTLAAMFESGPLVWFFKMRGPTADVTANRDAFRAWLESVRISQSEGS